MKFLFASFTLKFFLILSFILWNGEEVKAQVPAGSLMFVGFNADGSDGFAIAVLNAIPAGTVIYITDNGWSGTTFATTEGIVTWTVTTSIPTGNVVIFDQLITTPTVNFGTVAVTGGFNNTADGESLYMYQGTSTVPTNFITAFSTNNYGGANTLTGTGLTAGTNAIALTGDDDVCVYVPIGPCTVSIAACASQIANPTNWSCEDGTGDQSIDGGIDFPSSVPLGPTVTVLPIELISFTAELSVNNTVLLNWITSSELNNAYFEIEKRTANDNWELISRVTGAGNSQFVLAYSAHDRSLRTEQTYYRLSQTDFDGKKEVFNIVSVALDSEIKGIKVFPNPTSNVMYVQRNGLNQNDILIFDALGRNVTERVTKSELNNQFTLVSVNQLDKGKYLIRVGSESAFFVVQ